MDPITLAIGLFTLAAGGIISYAKYKYDNDPTTPGTSAYYNEQQLDLAKKNVTQNETVANNNYELSKEQFEYQKELNQKVMDREDSAYQRQVKDLQAAGLSPLMIGNGANAAPLTSAQAPQFDITGINQAISNNISAYNDIYNRKLNMRNFALQYKVNMANMYTQLAELSLQQKKARLENEILGEDLKYYRNHPERNNGIESVLINLASRYLGNLNGSSVIPGLNLSLGDVKDSVDPSHLFNKVDSSRSITIPKLSKEKPYSQEQVDKDIETINKANKTRFDKAFVAINIKKDFNQNAKIIWDYSNASDYYKNYDEFISVLSSQTNKYEYLKRMKIDYKPRERLKLGL